MRADLLGTPLSTRDLRTTCDIRTHMALSVLISPPRKSAVRIPQ